MPLTMTRWSRPVSMVSFSSLSVLGTRSAASTVAVRMSIFPNSSKVQASLAGSTFGAAAAEAAASATCRAALISARRRTCFSISASSIFEKRSSAGLSLWPTGSRSLRPKSSQLKAFTLRIRLSFSTEKGRNGAKASDRLAHNSMQVYRMAAVRAGSVLATAQGSVSEMYLLPTRARFMAALRASRNLKVSRLSSISRRISGIWSSASRSMGCSVPGSGTQPPKYLCVSTTARFTKLPKMPTNSLLCRVWKSFQVKSLSEVCGALAVST